MKNKKDQKRFVIGVDARPLSTSISGVGRVIAETLKSFPNKDEYEFHLFTHKPIHHSHIELLSYPNHFLHLSSGIFSKKGGIYFNIYLPFLLRKFKLDLFWGSQQVIPPFLPKNLPVVLTFYDLVSYFFPDTMRKIAAFQQRLFQNISVRRANHIVSISEQTKRDMIRVFHYDEKNASVAYPGVNYHDIQKNCKIPQTDRIRKIRSPFYLTVSTIEPRKNYPFLLQVYEEYSKMVSPKIKLQWVIAGKIGWESQEFIEKLKNKFLEDSDIIFIDSPTDSELHHLYSKTSLFLFASVYEGFGIPLVEALLHKKKSIVSDLPTFREIAEDQISYLSLNKPSDWASEMIRLQKSSKKIHFNPNKFLWKNSSLKMKKVFDSILKNEKN